MTILQSILLIVFFDGICDILGKNYAQTGKLWYAVGSVVAYAFVSSVWVWYLRRGTSLTASVVIFSVIPFIVAAVIGLLMYHEPITKLQMVGVVLGIISVMCLV